MPLSLARRTLVALTLACVILVLALKMSQKHENTYADHPDGHGHGHTPKDMWSGEDYLTRPGTQETATISHDLVLYALHGAGVPPNQIAGMDLLEIGCGAGAVTQHYAKSFGSVHAIDTSASMLLALSPRVPAKTTYSLHALNASSGSDFTSGKTMLSPTLADPKRHLAPPRSQFDVAVANLVVHHVDDIPGFMRGLAGLLKPSGWVVITEFAKKESNEGQLQGGDHAHANIHEQHGKHMADGSVNAPDHYHPSFTKESICELLEKYGFVDVHAEIRGRLPVFEKEEDWPRGLVARGRKL